ncbi:aspartate kinase [Haliea sp.]|jgi:aspartate kinase|uniref:aspartate kinase n=1 Tax=Haliea sp. TaxID=1932666 RepID=UPI0025BF54C1|nr:aspartate kinase [Haliea sp.]|tara:strand:- start:2373 stop:3902 length:1530 start_codon:yes stop_codon:yes gene_type:complete
MAEVSNIVQAAGPGGRSAELRSGRKTGGSVNTHTVEKIGGTSMSDYAAVRDSIVFGQRNGDTPYQRIFVVSAYGGITNKLLEHKKDGKPGVYGLFASSFQDRSWEEALDGVRDSMFAINAELFGEAQALQEANDFIGERLENARKCLEDLHSLCGHGHFSVEDHLVTVREMLSSVGEVHSAWNMATLLRRDGLNTRFVDLSGWQGAGSQPLDACVQQAFADIDLETELPVVTGYAHCSEGLITQFDRGYSEMTFSRIAVLTGAREAVIHKEFHLSSADPRLVGEDNAVPIGRTNYDVADQLANLGMEAIHPKAAKGLRQNGIPLRVKNTFEPEHTGTLITGDYVSDTACVEIIAGCRGVYALELFDQDMAGIIAHYDTEILRYVQRFKGHIVGKDINANTVTHYLDVNLKTVKRIKKALQEMFPEAEIREQKVAIVSAIGSDMQVPGLLARTVAALSKHDISVLAIHQSMRQVDIQFIVNDDDYEQAIRGLHATLVEPHDHGRAICLAS